MDLPTKAAMHPVEAGRRRWHPGFLFTPRLALPLTLAAGLLLPSNAAWSTFFYILGLPTIGWQLWRGARPDAANRPLLAMLALWAWSSLTIAWDRNISGQGDGHGYWLLNALCTLAFLLCFDFATRQDASARRRAVSAFILCAVPTALLSIALFAVQDHWTGRLGGWGALKTPVWGASVIVICVLLTLGRVAEAGPRRWLYAAALVPMLVYLPLNGSRTALLSLAVGVMMLGLSSWRAFRALAIAGLCALAALAGVVLMRPVWVKAVIGSFLARGTDCHITIWRTAWGLFLAQPVIGYGPSARLPILPHGACPAYPSPHNLYLSLLVYSGLVGFALYGLCQVLLCRHVLRRQRGFQRALALALLAVPLVSGLSDLTQVIKGPSPLWYIIWLPMLLALHAGPESPGTSPASAASPPRG